jgi:alpha-tubulin suppressor-like RCC1 family protein
MYRVFAVLAIAVLATISSCAPEPAAPSDGTPNPVGSPALLAVSGDTQMTIPHGPVPYPLVVRAVDANNAPLAGVVIRWTAQDGSHVAAESSLTQRDGTARATWIMGGAAGTYTVRALAGDLAPPVTFTGHADPVAVQVVMEADTLRMRSLGDRVRPRLRITRGDRTILAGIRRIVMDAESIVAIQPDTGVLLRAVRNGAMDLEAGFGDTLFPFHVIVEQVAVRTAILMDSGPPGVDTLTIGPGHPRQLRLTGVDARGNPIDEPAQGTVTWSASDSSTVELAATGIVTGLTDGTVLIQASAENMSASAPLRVWSWSATDIGGQGTVCARTQDGEIACWGLRDLGWYYGVPNSAVPELQLFGRFDTLVVSETHACGLRNGGEAWCWGRNDFGALGNGTVDSAAFHPTRVQGTARFTTLSLGEQLSCGLTADGQAWCWGVGSGGVLGDGTYGSAPCTDGLCAATPVRVHSSIAFTSISATGSHVCALDATGTAWCWGYNDYGQLGSPRQPCNGWSGGSPGERQCAIEPVRVNTTLRFESISTGGLYTCAVALDGQAYCWGLNIDNAFGDPSISTRSTSEKPLLVPTTASLVRVVAASLYSPCALTAEGEAWCWGDWNWEPSCGPSGCDIRPAPMPGGLRWRQFVHGCGIATDGIAYCWGDGLVGRLGNGTRGYASLPVRVLYQR